MPLDPSRLLLLPLIRERGSVTAAAHALNRTPPAISQQVARLENEVGTPLVWRSTRGAHLTRLGEVLARHAETIADTLSGAQHDLEHHLRAHSQRLRVGAFPTAGLAILPQALAALRNRNPGAELSVVDLGPDEGIDLVATGQLDVSVAATFAEPFEPRDDVALEHLLDDPLHVVLPVEHAHAASESPRLIDFADEPWAAGPRTLPNRAQLDRAASRDGFTPHVPFEFESYAVAQSLVSVGVAVAFVPEMALTRAPGTVALPLEQPRLSRSVYAVSSFAPDRAPLSPEFVSLLRQTCAAE